MPTSAAKSRARKELSSREPFCVRRDRKERVLSGTIDTMVVSAVAARLHLPWRRPPSIQTSRSSWTVFGNALVENTQTRRQYHPTYKQPGLAPATTLERFHTVMDNAHLGILQGTFDMLVDLARDLTNVGIAVGAISPTYPTLKRGLSGHHIPRPTH